MPYQVFALKWRPKNFEEIIGQPNIVSSLKSSLQKGAIANAYLFCGPRGVGKTSCARILAKALSCDNGPTPNPCLKCGSCVEISEGRSLDVIEIDGASNRGIDEIRALRENAKFAPVRGKYKVYIIDEVHQITADGFNALLKTLEEPPPYVKFIFATTHPHKVIPTVLSRCQRLDFRRISVMEIIGQLERIAAAQSTEAEKEALAAIARSADGSLRDAESVLEQLSSFARGRISLADVVSLLGIVEQDALFAAAEHVIRKDSCAVLALLDKLIDQGKDTNIFLSHLIEHFRNLMVAKASKADAKLIDLPAEACERLLKQSQAFSMEEILSAFNVLVNAQEMSKRLDSARIPLEIALVRLTQEKKGLAGLAPAQKHSPAPTAEARPQTVKAAPPRQVAVPEPLPGEAPDQPTEQAKQTEINDGPAASGGAASAQAQQQEFSLEQVKKVWQEAISSLEKTKISVANYLAEGEPQAIQGNTLTVSFPQDYSLHKEALEARDNRSIIEGAIGRLLQAKMRVNFTLSRREKKSDNFSSDSFVQSALRAFNARLLKEE